MKPLRVLHVIESLGRGGAERQLVNLVLAHDRQLIQPSVITLNSPLDLADELCAAGIAVMTLNLPALWQLPLAAVRLAGLFRTIQPDVVHTWLTRADLGGRIAAVLGGHSPVVSSVQAPIYAPSVFLDNAQQTHWKLNYIRWLDKQTSRRANVVHVGCSHSVAQSTAKALLVPPERWQMIHNSVVIPPVPVRIAGQRLICVGRLAAQKGQRYLIAAMPIILNHHPQATLQIVGDGPLKAELHAQIDQLGLHQAVTLAGLRSDIPELLAAHNVFVFPSLWEGLPLVAMEALAAELPLVGSDIPPIREIIDDGVHGILVQPQKPQALADAIINLLDNPERGSMMGIAGRQRIAERFDITVTVRQWEQLYFNMMEQQ